MYKVDHEYMRVLNRTLNVQRNTGANWHYRSHLSKPSVSFTLRMPDDDEVGQLKDQIQLKQGATLSLELRTSKSQRGRLFRFDLHDPRSMANTMSNLVELRAGFRYDLLVLPQVTIPAENLRELSFGERNCRYRDESERMVWHKVRV